MTDISNTNYHGAGKTDTVLAVSSGIELFGILFFLLGLSTHNVLLAVCCLIATIGAAIVGRRANRATKAHFIDWARTNHNVTFTPGDVQRLQKGETVTYGDDYWLLTRNPYQTG